MKEEQNRVKQLLVETISILCKNSLTYNNSMLVQGVIGITLDEENTFIVHINEEVEYNRNAVDHPVINDRVKRLTNKPYNAIEPYNGSLCPYNAENSNAHAFASSDHNSLKPNSMLLTSDKEESNSHCITTKYFRGIKTVKCSYKTNEITSQNGKNINKLHHHSRINENILRGNTMDRNKNSNTDYNSSLLFPVESSLDTPTTSNDALDTDNNAKSDSQKNNAEAGNENNDNNDHNDSNINDVNDNNTSSSNVDNNVNDDYIGTLTETSHNNDITDNNENFGPMSANEEEPRPIKTEQREGVEGDAEADEDVASNHAYDSINNNNNDNNIPNEMNHNNPDNKFCEMEYMSYNEISNDNYFMHNFWSQNNPLNTSVRCLPSLILSHLPHLSLFTFQSLSLHLFIISIHFSNSLPQFTQFQYNHSLILGEAQIFSYTFYSYTSSMSLRSSSDLWDKSNLQKDQQH